jgi:Cof subfamily protein (haloacid dehalogenase superfamily)
MPMDKNRRFNMVAIDCDGTLLDSNKAISTGAKEAIEKANAAGIQTTLITGRNVDAVKFIIESLELSGPIIGSGGAFIYHPQTQKVLETHTLQLAKTIELVHLCREFNAVLYLDYIHFSIFEKDNERMDRLNRLHEYHRSKVTDLVPELDSEPVKAMIIEEEDINAVVSEIRKRDLFHNIVFADDFSADILPEGVNKGTGLKSLSAIENIPLNRIAVIGDWLNDLDMFKLAGYSVAMGNSPDPLKAEADLIAPSNDEGGVAWAIEQIIQQ